MAILFVYLQTTKSDIRGAFHYAVKEDFLTHLSYYNSSSVCLFVCSLCTPRSFDGSSPNLVGICRLTSHLPLRGSFSKRSTGRRVTFAFHYIIYAPASLHTLQRHLLLGKEQSLIRRLLLCCMSTTYVGGPGNCY